MWRDLHSIQHYDNNIEDRQWCFGVEFDRNRIPSELQKIAEHLGCGGSCILYCINQRHRTVGNLMCFFYLGLGWVFNVAKAALDRDHPRNELMRNYYVEDLHMHFACDGQLPPFVQQCEHLRRRANANWIELLHTFEYGGGDVAGAASDAKHPRARSRNKIFRNDNKKPKDVARAASPVAKEVVEDTPPKVTTPTSSISEQVSPQTIHFGGSESDEGAAGVAGAASASSPPEAVVAGAAPVFEMDEVEREEQRQLRPRDLMRRHRAAMGSGSAPSESRAHILGAEAANMERYIEEEVSRLQRRGDLWWLPHAAAKVRDHKAAAKAKAKGNSDARD
jgi:hypothetical protein